MTRAPMPVIALTTSEYMGAGNEYGSPIVPGGPLWKTLSPKSRMMGSAPGRKHG